MLGFDHAFRGIQSLFLAERNFRIQFICFILIVAAAMFFDITLPEWLSILIISGVVLSLEALNSSIEKLCDLYSTDENSSIKWIKDVAAGGVLISSLFAIVIAIFIFAPRICQLLR